MKPTHRFDTAFIFIRALTISVSRGTFAKSLLAFSFACYECYENLALGNIMDPFI